MSNLSTPFRNNVIVLKNRLLIFALSVYLQVGE